MAITNANELLNAMGNNSSRIIIDKASIANSAVGQFHSLWRATGQPGQGAIPTSAARCIHTTTGALNFTQQTAPAKSYLGLLEGLSANVSTTLEIHDRLMHMGGLTGASAAAQTADLDLHANIASDNLAERIGSSDYSDVQWWLEWYTETGATVVTATVNVTYDDASSGDLTAVSLAATRRASFMQPLNGLIPAADSGKYIRDVNTVTLSATTGTGNFGVTATRFRAANYTPIANARFTSDWVALGLPSIANSACLFPLVIAGATSTGIQRAAGKILHG
jgi:hypothetical protein